MYSYDYSFDFFYFINTEAVTSPYPNHNPKPNHYPIPNYTLSYNEKMRFFWRETIRVLRPHPPFVIRQTGIANPGNGGEGTLQL
jgi:hypothetical protein